METWLSILVAIALAIALVWYWVSSSIKKRSEETVRLALRTWAALGPFENGSESAQAMKHSYIAVFGPEGAGKMAHAFQGHAEVYDGDPVVWEKTRQETLQAIGPDIEDQVAIAKGGLAMDSLNEDFIEAGGHKLEYVRQEDGSIGIAYKQILSDDEVAAKKAEDSELIRSAIGKSLIENDSEEARAFVSFLSDLYSMNRDKDPTTPLAIGSAWFAGLQMQDELPEFELTKKFTTLKDEYDATQSDTDDTNLNE